MLGKWIVYVVVALLIAGCGAQQVATPTVAPTFTAEATEPELTATPSRTPFPTETPFDAQAEPDEADPDDIAPPPTQGDDGASATTLQDGCSVNTAWAFTYTVRSGDTLSEIAQRAGVTLVELAESNCIQIDVPIFTGQRIRTPQQLPALISTRTSTPDDLVAPLSTDDFANQPDNSETELLTEEPGVVAATETDTPTGIPGATATDTPTGIPGTTATPTQTDTPTGIPGATLTVQAFLTETATSAFSGSLDDQDRRELPTEMLTATDTPTGVPATETITPTDTPTGPPSPEAVELTEEAGEGADATEEASPVLTEEVTDRSTEDVDDDSDVVVMTEEVIPLEALASATPTDTPTGTPGAAQRALQTPTFTPTGSRNPG
ncbi:MAG: LysM peptidoglycan-binding domain-containing protein [Chloroflexota bacterium]